jgi:hypothetical protein
MMTLGPFLVAQDGTLSPRAPGLRPLMRFAWRGRLCAAEVTDGGLRLTALVGRIPSTIERHADRGAVVRAVGGLRDNLPRGLSFHLLPDHRLLLRRQGVPRPPGAPLAATVLVSELVRFVLALDPCLDQLEAAGAMAAPMPAAMLERVRA